MVPFQAPTDTISAQDLLTALQLGFRKFHFSSFPAPAFCEQGNQRLVFTVFPVGFVITQSTNCTVWSSKSSPCKRKLAPQAGFTACRHRIKQWLFLAANRLKSLVLIQLKTGPLPYETGRIRKSQSCCGPKFGFVQKLFADRSTQRQTSPLVPVIKVSLAICLA